MDRRSFLKVMLGTGTAFMEWLLSAAAVAAVPPRFRPQRPRPKTVRVSISLNDSSHRTIRVRPGTSVMEAIVDAYPCQTGSGGTTINGQPGPWKYYLNDIMPPVHACQASISRESTVEIKSI